MKERILKASDFIIYWAMIIMPFSVAISPAMANIFIGLMASFYLLKKALTPLRKMGLMSTPIDMPFALMVIIAGLSFINSVDMSNSFHGIAKLIKYGLILLVYAEELRDALQVKRLVFSCILGVVLISLDGAWQLIFGFDFIRSHAVQSSIINLARPTASFPNPNIMGIYLSALAPLAIGPALFLKTGNKKKILLVLASLAAVAGVTMTFSRGSGLGLFTSVLALGIFKRKKLLIASLLILLLVFPLVMPKNIKNWSQDIKYDPLVFLFNRDRISMYRNTLNMIRHHPFLGVGVNTFSQNYAKYKLPEAEKYFHTQDTTYTHDIYLQMAGETGLLGLSAFLWLLFAFFKDNLRTTRALKDDFLRLINLSLCACVIAFLINGITETSLYYPRVSMVFWFLIGSSLGMRRLIKTDG